MLLRRLVAPSLVAATAVILGACGSDADSSGGSTPAATGEESTGSNQSVTLNDADVEFAQGMMAHHEQAIEMAEIALDPNVGADAAVVALATRVQAAQDPEVDRMTAWLEAARAPMTMDMSEGHDMSSMDGMMSAEQMDAMATATGVEFDQMWLELMIEHHEGAISQAQEVKANGSDPDLLTLADEIITAQGAEIAELQALREG